MSAPAALDERAAEHLDIGGVAVPAHFGDPAGEYEAARSAVGLMQRAGRALFRIAGGDRATFLQGLLTNDVVALQPGQGCQALFLDIKGHVRGALDLWATDDAIIAGCEPDFIDGVLPDLTKYVLAADVQASDLRGEETVLALVGPGADAALARAGVVTPTDARGLCAATLGGVAVRVARTEDLGAAGVEVHTPVAAVNEVWCALEQATGESVPVYIGWNAAEALRLEAGVVRSGHEVSGEEFPQELRLDAAINYEKGCYLGQETVARIHYRGQVNRLLSGLRADSPLPVGAELISSGREVGRITSTAQSPRLGSIALAMVRREESEGGAAVEVHVDGSAVADARVTGLPIES